MAGQIPLSQASPLFTTAIRARFDEIQDIHVNNFFRSFFAETICQERYPAIDVRRGTERVAVDVIRGHQGIRTQIDKSTQKAFDPFNYKYYFDATELNGYFRVFGSQSFNVNMMAELANGVAIHNKTNQDLIERAIELHCASIMETGTVTSLRDGSVVDFHRKAASMVDLGAISKYWTDPTSIPYTDLFNGGVFLRQVGKCQGYVINAVFGVAAWQAFRANPAVQERLKEFNNKRDLIEKAQIESTGAIYQGEIDCDSYTIRCWTYNEYYDKDNGDGTFTSTPYMNPKKVYMVPPNPQFTLLYGAIPQVVQQGTNTASLVAAKFVLKRFVNEEFGYDRSYIESCPLPVPVAVDRIYTMQVVA